MDASVRVPKAQDTTAITAKVLDLPERVCKNGVQLVLWPLSKLYSFDQASWVRMERKTKLFGEQNTSMYLPRISRGVTA